MHPTCGRQSGTVARTVASNSWSKCQKSFLLKKDVHYNEHPFWVETLEQEFKATVPDCFSPIGCDSLGTKLNKPCQVKKEWKLNED